MPPRHERDAAAATVTVVAALREHARAAARFGRSRAPRARLTPSTLREYLAACGENPPGPVVLAGAGKNVEADRRFFESARDRLLWSAPPPEVYAAISGLRTDLPARRRPAGAGLSAPPYLLLEGNVTAARARGALDSPVRDWIVEHAGRVRIGDRELARLEAAGVRWSVLWPVRLVGVVDRLGASRGLFERRIPVWR